MQIEIAKGPSGRILNLRTLVAELQAADILRAIDMIREGKANLDSFQDSTGYDLLFEGNRYPPKQVFAVAVARLFGRTLASDEFTGGEASPCFGVLRKHGFEVAPKTINSSLTPLPDGLKRYCLYDREEISKLFEPEKAFRAGTGTWGLQGIVEAPKDSGNFVFMVTLGKPTEGNPYRDDLTEDGYLIWESQTRQSFRSPAVQRLLNHDPAKADIHLFIRPSENCGYTYFGRLEYFSHDPLAQNPVHFIWSILGWDLDKAQLASMGFSPRQPLDPSFSPLPEDTLIPELCEDLAPKTRKSGNTKVRTPASDRAKSNIDWAAKDERNRKLGKLGEELVVQHERKALIAAGRADLAERIAHVALSNSSAGFDVSSFFIDGRPKLIEVKTTQGPASTPFFISANEIRVSRDNPENYRVYRIYGFAPGNATVSFYVIDRVVDQACDLEPITYRAFLKTD